MNSDDMNDAEFDAFLNGEDALSRELQAMPQAAPSAGLDAAILNRAQSLMGSERRPAAANDASNGVSLPLPRLGLRWRVPFGIAATLMAGVLAHQAWQASTDGNRAAEVTEATPAPVSQPAPAQETVVEADKSAPAPMLAKTAPPRPKQPAPHRSVPQWSTTPVEKYAPEVSAPVPPPPPVFSYYSRASVPAAAPAPVAAESSRAQASTVDISARRSRVESQRSSDAVSAQPGATAAAAPDPKVWLAAIDELLKAGLRRDTLEEWDKFRAAYPDYPVPAETTGKISALRK